MSPNTPSPADLARSKALRVKLAMRYHLLLHRLKVTTGQNMASVIEDALDLYFEKNPVMQGSQGSAPAPSRPEPPSESAQQRPVLPQR